MIECTFCSSGKYNDVVASSECKWCDSGKINTETGRESAQNCISCAVGRYEYADQSETKRRLSCHGCPSGRYNPLTSGGNIISCKNCTLGTYQNEVSQGGCKGCPIGYFNDQIGQVAMIDSCKKCPVGTFQTSLSTDNSVGGHGSLAEGCLLCRLGKYRSSWPLKAALPLTPSTPSVYESAAAATECDKCVPGQYQHVRGQIGCNFCATDKGHFHLINHGVPNSLRVGEVDDRNCLDCPTGKQSNKEHDGCSDCDMGKYKTLGQTGCQDCLPCDKLGTSRWSQHDTAPIMSCFGSSGGDCKLCTQNQWKGQVGEWNSQCVTCDDGWTASEDRSRCVRCVGNEAGTNGWCGADNAAGGGLTCESHGVASSFLGEFPNEKRTRCRQIENVHISSVRRGRANNQYLRHDVINVTWTSNNLEMERYVVRLCRNADRSSCHSADGSKVLQDVHIRDRRHATIPLTFCNSREGDLELFAQVGYNAGTVNHDGGDSGKVNLGLRVRGSSTNSILLLKNKQPILSSINVRALPTVIYETTPVISCDVDRRSIVDVDAMVNAVQRDPQSSSASTMPSDKSIGISSFTFRKGTSSLKSTIGGTRNVMYFTKDHSIEPTNQFECVAQPTDRCGVGVSGVDPTGTASKETITVRGMSIAPTTGKIRGGESVVVTGRGFVSESEDDGSTLYTCSFGDGGEHKWPGRGVSASAIECTTGNYFHGGGATKVHVSGPVVQYRGCWKSTDLSSAFTVINMEERQTSLMRCQVLCSLENSNNVFYGLRNTECLCSDDVNLLTDVVLSKKQHDNRCETQCLERIIKTTPTIVGCFTEKPDKGELSDLPITEREGDDTITCKSPASSSMTCDSMTPLLCSSKCQGYLYFGVFNGKSCRCGNTYGKFGLADHKSSTSSEATLSELIGESCYTPCYEDTSQLCGGPYASVVYSQTTAMLPRASKDADAADQEQPLTCGSQWPGWIPNQRSFFHYVSPNLVGSVVMRAFDSSLHEAVTRWSDISVPPSSGTGNMTIVVDLQQEYVLKSVALRTGEDVSAERGTMQYGLGDVQVYASRRGGVHGPWYRVGGGEGSCDRNGLHGKGAVFALTSESGTQPVGAPLQTRWIKLEFQGYYDGSEVAGFHCMKKMTSTPRLRSNGIQFYGSPFGMLDSTEDDSDGTASTPQGGAVSIFGHMQRTNMFVGDYNMEQTEPGPIGTIVVKRNPGQVKLVWETPIFTGGFLTETRNFRYRMKLCRGGGCVTGSGVELEQSTEFDSLDYIYLSKEYKGVMGELFRELFFLFCLSTIYNIFYISNLTYI